MPRLFLRLLGTFQVTLNGEPVHEFHSDKVRGLLTYLALESNRSHRRDTLTGLFWPEMPDAAARRNLRISLHHMRRAIAGEKQDTSLLSITPGTVQFNSNADIWLDVSAFYELLAACEAHSHYRLESCQTCMEKLREAVELYRGDFLQGFFLDDCLAFTEWVVIRRERLHRHALEALYYLAEYHRLHGETKQALRYAYWQLELEPWREEAHRQVMQVLVLSGERSAALAQYERCRIVMADELGVDPSSETTELYDLIRDTSAKLSDLLAEDIGQNRRSSPTALPCPYRGLLAFSEEEAPFYFGREAFVARLVSAVQQNSLVTLLGASGSGKSSVVYAGLLPQLRKKISSSQSQTGSWVIAPFRPGSRPFHALASILLPYLEMHLGEHELQIKISALAEMLGQGAANLCELADQILRINPGASHFLLVIDQLEELFTLCPEPEIRRRFLDMLLDAAISVEKPALTAILIMRADFTSQALAYRRFADAMQDSILILGPMTREELKWAIENPAYKQGATFESGLVERILHDVVDEPGYLPLLEFALTSLWDQQDDGRLSHAAYEEIGQVEGALVRYAEEVYHRFSQSEREQARWVFVQLLRPGEGTEDTRRLATRAELGEYSWRLAQRLADARLVVTNRYQNGQDTVEIAHEALIRNWERLRGWMEADRAFRTWQERLRGILRQWEEGLRDEGALLRGAPLVEAEGWLNERGSEFSEAERDFIRESLILRERRMADREEQRQRELDAAHRLAETEARRAKEHAQAARQLRRRAFLLTGALVIAIILAATALVFGQHAAREARLALSRQLAVQATSNLTGQLDLALLLSLEAYRLDPGFETRSSLAESLQHEPRLVTFLHGHQDKVLSVAFSPDGGMLASGSVDKTIILWDVSNPKTPVQLGAPMIGHKGPLYSVAFSPDGRLLASGSVDKTIILWDVSNPKTPVQLGAPLIGHKDTIYSVAFSPDGKLLASSSLDKAIILWDVSNREAPVQLGSPLTGHQDSVMSVAFSPDGKMLASGGSDKTIILWDVSNPKTPSQHGRPLIGHKLQILRLAFSPDGRLLASSSMDKTIILWDVSNRETPVQLGSPLTGHNSPVPVVAFSPDGKTLASGGGDQTIRLWDISNPEMVVQLDPPLTGHTGWVVSLSFSSDSKHLASGSSDNTAILWDVSHQRSPTRLGQLLTGHREAVRGICISRDGRLLASTSEDKTIMLWDVHNQRPIGPPLTGHTDIVWWCAFSPDGKLLASASKDKTIRLWNADTQQQVGSPLAAHIDQVNSVAFSPDGRVLASSSDDKTMILWDVSNPESPVQLTAPLTGHTDWVGHIVFSPDGKLLASASGDKTLILWDVSNPESPVQSGLPLIGHTKGVFMPAFSPDGKLLASIGEDNTIFLWDVSNPNLPGRLSQAVIDQEGNAYSVAFSPDSKMLASGGGDGIIILWDISNSRSSVQLVRLIGHMDAIMGVIFSPDGKMLASGALDARIILWNIDFDSWHDLACQIANRNLTVKEWERYLGDEPYKKTCVQIP